MKKSLLQAQSFSYFGGQGVVEESEPGLVRERTISLHAPADFANPFDRGMVKIFPERKVQDFMGGDFRITGNSYATEAEIKGHCIMVNDLDRSAFLVAGRKDNRETIA